MIETIRIEGRARTRALDMKAFELTGPGLNSEALCRLTTAAPLIKPVLYSKRIKHG